MQLFQSVKKSDYIEIGIIFFTFKPPAPMALFTVWKSKLLMPVAININIDANLPNAEVNYKIYSETSTQTLHTCLIMLNYLFKVLLFPTSNTNIMKMCFFLS